MSRDPLKQQLWTALVTPMQPGGSVDYESLESLIARQESAGNGILLLGSTGEGLALSAEEKRSIVSFVAEHRPDVPVMAGVGGFNIESQLTWIDHCNEAGVDAFLLVSPLYSKPGPAGMQAWFERLLDRTGRPSMLYNIPGRTGVKIPPSVVANLSVHPCLWSLKEASGSMEEYLEFLNQAPDVSLYSGDDARLPLYSDSGCKGLVSVAANVWPDATARYVSRTLEGVDDSFHELWQEASDALFCASNPIPAKRLLLEKGWIRSSTLRLPLTDREEVDLERLLAADSAVEEWCADLKA